MPDQNVTLILEAIVNGDPKAAEALLPLVYAELRKLAAAHVAREQRGNSIQATELVHEAYLRLLGRDADLAWDSRGHFFAAAAESMRRILVDRARARGAAKRGGGWKRISLDIANTPIAEIPAEIIELDAALAKLKAEEPEKARIVELRIFVGLTVEQTAAATGISSATVGRHWTYAKAWLYSELSKSE